MLSLVVIEIYESKHLLRLELGSTVRFWTEHAMSVIIIRTICIVKKLCKSQARFKFSNAFSKSS